MKKKYAILDTRGVRWNVVYIPRTLLGGMFLSLFHKDAHLFSRKGFTQSDGWRWECATGSGYCYFSSPEVAVGFYTMHHSHEIVVGG